MLAFTKFKIMPDIECSAEIPINDDLKAQCNSDSYRIILEKFNKNLFSSLEVYREQTKRLKYLYI